MPFTVDNHRANLNGGGARPTLFDVTIPFPTSAPDTAAATKLTFTAEASSLPASTVSEIIVPYFGRQIKLPGDRTFANWTITVQNDEDFKVRNAFERWMSALNSHFGNLRAPNALSTAGHSVDAYVKQYSKTGPAIKGYKMIGVWPTEVSSIELNWAGDNNIEKFTVTLAYQWWEADTTDGQGADVTSL